MTVLNEPLSWLTLERYALGELSASARRDVEARLAASPEDRACLDSILQDTSELPPLPTSVVPLKSPRKPKTPLLVAASTALAVAAAALLLVRSHAVPGSRRLYAGVKGGDVALALVSDRVGRDPSQFSEGERFKLLLTCPPNFTEPAKVLVFQGDQRFEPLPTERPACGNLVPWSGAFALSGDERVTVCVAWGDALEAATPRALGDDAVCTTLEAAP